MALHNKVGKIGETAACKHLRKQKYRILEKNYSRKWGEIDIIACNKKRKTVHFVEVKSVSCENLDDVSCETEDTGPEERVDERKQNRIARAIQTYIAENRLSGVEWQFDILVVFLDTHQKEAKVKELKNVIIRL